MKNLGNWKPLDDWKIMRDKEGYWMKIQNGPVVIFEGPKEFSQQMAEKNGVRSLIKENPELAKRIGLNGEAES